MPTYSGHIGLLAIIFLVILFSPSVAAVEMVSVEGFIHVDIINLPPEITNQWITPDTIYSDSTVTCNVDVKDENPDDVFIHYQWITSKGIYDGQTIVLDDVDEESDVQCIAYPVDIAGQQGPNAYSKASIAPTPPTTQLVKQTVTVFGGKTTTAEIVAAQEEGLLAVTGHVVGSLSPTQRVIPASGVILIVLILGLLVMNIALRFKLNQTKQKTFSTV